MISVSALEKWFGPIKAVDGISFDVQAGEVLGFLGPNGAGKSTTMRMITGYLPPSAGKVTLDGYDVNQEPVKAKRLFGYLPENAPAYPDMTVEAFLNFCAAIRGLKGTDRKNAVGKTIETCHLQKVRRQTIDTLSKGFHHRTCFAQAILHNPRALILDEPTDGLDPNQKHEMRNLIRTMGQSKAIVVSTHILEEVEAICTRVIIIDRGRLVFNGTPRQMKEKDPRAGDVTVTVTQQDKQRALELLKTMNTVKTITEQEQEQQTATLLLTPQDNTQNLAQAVKGLLDEKHCPFSELHTESGRLENVFQALTTSDSDRREAE